ncbi:hypothetical protein IGI37_001978 [Enterococcus sp. AZ194]|uniref:Gfo/Idh/MocA family protein n=1 Tax=Enterococcus sp. AZ194 TaxID=2774629 RepID=UPI003F29ADAF
MSKIRVAFVGVGEISDIYLKNLTTFFKNKIEIVGLCDLIRRKAELAAETYQIKKIYEDMYQVFADESVDIVLNLTRPNEHYEVTKAALESGKAVYSEKPLASTFEDGQKLFALAKERNLLVGGAPDTFLGAGIQTCKKLIEGGIIGTPVGFSASMICRGHETWHPGPAFYYEFGGGPMMDMGPYYVTALTTLLGAVKTVTAKTKTTFPKRLITSEPLSGSWIDVEVPTFVTGILEMASGVTGTLFTTFDCYEEEQASITIYGSEGTLKVPDPNTFGGPVYLLSKKSQEYKEIPLLFDYEDNSRGLGLLGMASALKDKKKFPADISQTYHALEVMTAFQRSNDQGKTIVIESEV